jgi:hypothetical protein
MADTFIGKVGDTVGKYFTSVKNNPIEHAVTFTAGCAITRAHDSRVVRQMGPAALKQFNEKAFLGSIPYINAK